MGCIMTARKPQEIVDYGCCWIRDHGRGFKLVMHLVHIEAESGNPCVQRGDIYNLARRRGLGVSDVSEFRRDNTLWSVIARYMVMLRPKLARSLNFQTTRIDKDVDMVERWHEIVNPNTFFLANSWREAKEAVKADDATAQILKG
ncbi:hypothetical protein [Gordonibacter sp.]|uniref:hypothetical protein n=1 Tax=Gordonibacter sp. TaxID=1968902 RepID=UPI002FCABB60